jgi:hypothetical protein
MRIIKSPINKAILAEINSQFGNYFKITVDLEKEILVLGCEFHVDGAGKLKLEEKSFEDNLWGGWLNTDTGLIDLTAVFNLRPNLKNFTMELIDEKRRKKFILVVKKLFAIIYE